MAKDNIVPFDAIDYLQMRFMENPNPTREEIRMEFRKTMIELYKAEEPSFRSMKIPELLNGLGKTCTKLADRFPKPYVRIALADYYMMTGIHVRPNGELAFNTH